VPYLVGGGLLCSASATGAGGCGMTAAGTTAMDCAASGAGAAAATVTRGSTTVGSTRREKRGGWLTDDWASPADDRDGWVRSNVCGTAAPPPRYGPLPRRGLHTNINNTQLYTPTIRPTLWERHTVSNGRI